MQAWAYTPSLRSLNYYKMHYMQGHFPEFSTEAHWQYRVMLHRCCFDGKIERGQTATIMEMLQGPMYNEEAFDAMERPLLELLVSLRSELKSTNLALFNEYRKHRSKTVEQIGSKRDSNHIDIDPDDGRTNEYILFFESQKRRAAMHGTSPNADGDE